MEDVIQDSMNYAIKNDIEDTNENAIKVVLYCFANPWVFLDKFII